MRANACPDSPPVSSGGPPRCAGADRQAEDQAPAAEQVQGGGLLGQQHGVAQRPDHHHGRQADAAGDGGRGRQRQERLDAAVHHPVQDADAGERPAVGASGPLHDRVAVGARCGGW
jgi:hypothetical protein